MHNYDYFIKFVERLGCECVTDEPMSKHTTFRVGGPADLFIKVGNKKGLIDIISFTNLHKIPVFVIGNGSNILVSDAGIRGIVVKLGGDFKKISFIDGNLVHCGAGVTLARLCSEAADNSLSGIEFAWGIPGTVGGAVFMNAGAYSGEMKDVIIKCNHLDRFGRIGSFGINDLKFSYRGSIYNKNRCIITDVMLRLKTGDTQAIRDKMFEYMSKRKSSQPVELPSAGSVFKRPEGNYAGTLIEDCGLKGKRIGGAVVSEKHAGFIVNDGGATCKDILDLINFVKSDVFSKTGVMLECEVKVI